MVSLRSGFAGDGSFSDSSSSVSCIGDGTGDGSGVGSGDGGGVGSLSGFVYLTLNNSVK